MMEKNRLSAFFDGEKHHSVAEQSQYEESFSDEKDNLLAWKSYVLTREVMREEGQNLQWDISAAVAKALEAEPAHQQQTTVVAMQEAQPTPLQAQKTLPSWLQQFAQVGSAAVICMAVILGVQQYNAHTELTATSQPPVLHTIPVSGEAAPVSFNREVVNANELQSEQQRQRVNELLQDFELQRRLNTMELEEQHK